jgi:Ca-activated chloride channel family protein
LTSNNYYDLLSIPFDATEQEIRDAYFREARRYHPDANPDKLVKDTFFQIQDAFSTLSDPEKRKQYNYRFTDQETHIGTSARVTLSQRTIPLLDERQLVYALLQINCDQEINTKNIPSVEICLVIDRSTSMKGSRLAMVKKNFDYIVSQLRPSDLISVIAFSDRAEILISPTRIGDLGDSRKKVSEIKTFGATEIFKGLDLGASVLRKSNFGSQIKTLYLLTDGHTYGDEKNCFQLAEGLANDGIRVSAMGFGDEWNDEFLDQMTGLSGGNAGFASSEKDLFDFFKEKITYSMSQYAQKVCFEFKYDEEVDLNYAFRMHPEANTIPVSQSINLGSLSYGQKIILILEFLIDRLPYGKKELSLIEGNVRMEALGREFIYERHLINASLPIHASFEKETPPPMMVEAMSRLTLYRMQAKARKEVEAKSLRAASKHLKSLAAKLEAQGEKDLAHTIRLEIEELKTHEKFSSEGEKRIKYGTRSLLLKSGLEQE